MPGYSCHFVPVKYCGQAHAVSGAHLPHDTDFQAAVEQDASAWTFQHLLQFAHFVCCAFIYVSCSRARARHPVQRAFVSRSCGVAEARLTLASSSSYVSLRKYLLRIISVRN